MFEFLIHLWYTYVLRVCSFCKGTGKVRSPFGGKMRCISCAKNGKRLPKLSLAAIRYDYDRFMDR